MSASADDSVTGPEAAGWALRPARESDLSAIVELLCAADVEELGRPDTGDEDVRQSWRAPGMNMGTDTWVAIGALERLPGYAEITRRPTSGGATELDGDFWVHPEIPAAGTLAETLLQRIVGRAGELADERSPAHLAVFCAHRNPKKRALLESYGFTARRRLLRMAIDLPAGYGAPLPPAGIRVADFDPAADADAVRRLMIAAFSDDFRPRAEPLAEWRARLLERSDFDPSLWPLAWEERGGSQAETRGPAGRHGARLVGAAIAYDFGDIGWVQGLAVAADRRGRGFGTALLREAFARFANHGQREVRLGVDADNETGALGLYERAGMRQEQRVDLYVRTA